MTKLSVLLCGIYFLSAFQAIAEMGDERIVPVNFPNFYVAGDYGLVHRVISLDDTSLSGKLDSRWGGALGFNVGILPNVHAGATVAMNVPLNLSDGEPLKTSFSIFIKPTYSFSERFSAFVKASGGIAAIVKGDALSFSGLDSSEVFRNQAYKDMAFGFALATTAGLEAFLTSRFGVAGEGGIKSDIFFHLRDGIVREGSPALRKYLLYNWFVGLNLLMIL